MNTAPPELHEAPTSPARAVADQAQPDSGAVPTSAPGSRMAWVDLVKATSVLLVVFMHFVLTLRDTTITPMTDFWFTTMAVLEPFRMPTFFVVSGLLASSALKRNWGANRRRTLGGAYLYVVWSTIMTVLGAVLALSLAIGDTVTELLWRLAIPPDGYWFLYALALYFVIAKLAMRQPHWLVLGAAALIAVFRTETTTFIRDALAPWHDPGMLSAVALNLVFFLVGVYYKEIVASLAGLARWRLVLPLGGIAAAMSLVRFWNPDDMTNYFLLISMVWIATGIMTSQLLVRWPGPRRFGAYLGARTLPIFVIQFPLMQVPRLWSGDSIPGFLDSGAAQFLYPIVATVLVAGIGIALYELSRSGPLRHLFTAPDWVAGTGASRRVRAPGPGSQLPVTSPEELRHRVEPAPS